MTAAGIIIMKAAWNIIKGGGKIIMIYIYIYTHVYTRRIHHQYAYTSGTMRQYLVSVVLCRKDTVSNICRQPLASCRTRTFGFSTNNVFIYRFVPLSIFEKLGHRIQRSLLIWLLEAGVGRGGMGCIWLEVMWNTKSMEIERVPREFYTLGAFHAVGGEAVSSRVNGYLTFAKPIRNSEPNMWLHDITSGWPREHSEHIQGL